MPLRSKKQIKKQLKKLVKQLNQNKLKSTDYLLYFILN
jgi:hypothetical protein